jgi:hypothetical protein
MICPPANPSRFRGLAPSRYGDSEGLEHLGLTCVRPADQLDRSLAGAHELEADLGQLSQGTSWRHVLEGKVRVHHLPSREVLRHNGLDRGGQHAQRGVTPDTVHYLNDSHTVVFPNCGLRPPSDSTWVRNNYKGISRYEIVASIWSAPAHQLSARPRMPAASRSRSGRA